MIGLTFLKEFMLIEQVHQKSIIFFTKGFKGFKPYVCNKYHDLLMMSMNFSGVAISSITGSDYRFITSEINKSEAINLIKSISLTEKSGVL